MTLAYLGVGSNLGDRLASIERALLLLGHVPGVAVGRRSCVYETAPVGGPAGQGAYLNLVVEVETTLTAGALLATLHRVEDDLGRVRTVVDGPRTLDLDLLLFGDEVVLTPTLVIPHPRLHERLFVLEPLAELASGVVHPTLNVTVARLRADLLGVRPLTASPGRELAGLRALVTGSTSGIGKAVALELASAGADVIVHGRRSPGAADEVAREVMRRGVRGGVLMADMSEPAAVARLADDAWNLWGGVDILVCNAGADTLTGEAAGWDFERKLEELLAVDVGGTIRLCRDLGRRMKFHQHGVILTVGWDQAETGMEGDSGELFAATKGAVMCFTRSLALSLAPEVRVHCIAPGWIRTAWGDQASSEWQERVRRETPLGVWGRPQDVAAAARWLASPAAAYLTGQTVRVNGGAVR